MAYGNTLVRALFFHSPGFVRDLAATMYSVRERHRKFTAHTRACLTEIENTERWPTSAQLALQGERLQAMAVHAAERVPHWAEVFRAAGVEPRALRSAADLASLPFLRKDDILAAGERMWARGFGRHEVS